MKKKAIVWTGDLHSTKLQQSARWWSKLWGYKSNEIFLLNYDYDEVLHNQLPQQYRLPEGDPDQYFIEKLKQKGYEVEIRRSSI